jgi:O-antigen/teichoic acid export membrane protein
VYNLAAAATAAVVGVLVARALGPTVRGEYAAIMAWFGVLLTVGQLGQSTATTFHVAREPDRAADYLATSRNLMLLTGGIAIAAGVVAAPYLASGDPTVTWGYRLMFATCVASFVGASYTFSLLALSVTRWNVVRISQPVAFLGAVTALYLAGWLELLTLLVSLSATVLGQTLLAYLLCGRERLTGGSASRVLARPLTRYGMSHLASSIPRAITDRLDLLVLSLTVAPAALGLYAVANSLTTLAAPVVGSLGSVLFPRIASRTLSAESGRRLQRRALWMAAALAVGLVLPLVLAAPWLVPFVFGPPFRDAVPLVALLAPAGMFLALGRVCGDLLRGHGQPLAVARAQMVSAVTMVVLLSVLVPRYGVTGAALASSSSAGIAVLLMVRKLRRLERPVEVGGGR